MDFVACIIWRKKQGQRKSLAVAIFVGSFKVCLQGNLSRLGICMLFNSSHGREGKNLIILLR